MITHHWTNLTHTSTPNLPTISDYNGSEQDSDGHNTIKTNINVLTLLLL